MSETCTDTIRSEPGATEMVTFCGGHNFHRTSLRGTNRDQRVEHLRCWNCGARRTRVWLDLPKQSSPDRVYKLDTPDDR